MCHWRDRLAFGLIAFGAGIVLTVLMESMLWRLVLGSLCITLGVLLLKWDNLV